MREGYIECKIDRQVCAASAVLQPLYWTIGKRELFTSQSILRSALDSDRKY